jgi:hypothetical protein
MDIRTGNSAFNSSVNQVAAKGSNISNQDLQNATQSALQNDGVIDESEAQSLRELGSVVAKSSNDTKLNSIQNFASSQNDPIKKGLNFIMEGARNQRAIDKTSHQEGFVGGIAKSLSTGTGIVASSFQGITGRDQTGKTPEQRQLEQTSLKQKNLAPIQISDPAKNTTCVGDALSMIKKNVTGPQAQWRKPSDSVDLSNPETAKANLKSTTGMDWSVRDLKTNDPATLLRGKEGRAMITDNGHAYAYLGMHEGKVKVTDRSGQPKLLDPKKDNITAFIPGKVVGNDSVAAKDRNMQTYANIMSTPNMQREKGTESGEIRKAFVFMSDPSMKDKMPEFTNLVKNVKDMNDTQNIDKLSNFLKSQKPPIDLGKDELVAMTKSLTAPLPANSKIKDFYGKEMPKSPANMLEAFSMVKNSRSENSNTVVSGLEYSGPNLNNFFTNTTSVSKNAQVMLDQLNMLLAGRDGC